MKFQIDLSQTLATYDNSELWSLINIGSVLSDGGNYDFQCKAKLTKRNPPLLYDLNSDPGERYPLDSATYSSILEIMMDLKKTYKETVPWAPSEILKGQSKEAFPCCGSPNRDCTPFPECCNCP